MTEFMGKDGFVWWQGVVEDRHDPLYLGRCRVRILGWHTEDKTDMPTESLPWSYPVQPITSAAQTGVGISPTGPVEGTWVVGFYRDGEQAQEPVFFGTLGGIPEEPATINVGFNDPRGDTEEFHPDLGHKFDYPEISLTFNGETLEKNIPYPPKKMTHYQPFTQPDHEKDKEQNFKRFISHKGGVEGPPDASMYVEIEEEAARSTYPRKEYLNEPTTPRAARGKTGQTPTEYASGILGQKMDNWGVLNGASGFFTASKKQIRTTGPGGRVRITSSTPYSWSEPHPASLYGAKYPYNHVHESESGHLIEIDDTPGKERLHRYHRTGTYEEIGSLGQRIVKVVNENFHMGLNNDYTAILGNKYENITGKLDIVSGQGYYHSAGKTGAIDMTAGSFKFNLAAGGSISVNNEGMTLDAGEGGVLLLKGNSLKREFKTAAATDRIKGGFTQEIDGLYSLESGSMSLASRASTGITTGGDLITTTTGGIREVILNLPLPPALPSLTARQTTAALGDINFNTANFGVGNFNVDIGPMLPVDLAGFGFLKGGTSFSATPLSFSVNQGIAGLPTSSSLTMSPAGIILAYGTNSISITAAGISIIGTPNITVGSSATAVTTVEGVLTNVKGVVTSVEGSIVKLN